MRRDARGRITVPDVVRFLAALAFLGALYPVFDKALGNHLTGMATPTIWMFRLLLPMALLIMLALIFRKASVGGGA